MRDWLIETRKSKSMTQDEVATKSGISRQYYSFIESGDRNCPVETAKKIADALGFEWTKFFE
jgi:transcriptional regulator with XRE-family HTH domain